MHRKSFFVFIVSVLSITFLLCGFAFGDKVEVAVDPNKNCVYRYETIDTVISDFEAQNKKEAEKKYKNQYILMSAEIKSKDKNGKKVTLTDTTKQVDFVCTCDKNVQEEIKKYEIGDKIAVYGKFSVDAIDKENHIKMEKVTFIPTNINSSDTYFTLDGTSFDFTNSLVRNLNDGRIKYHIPETWKDIEINIKENDIGTIEGYQYVLNKVPGSADPIPESLFVCYFDKKLLKEVTDINNTKEVEKIIVENIEGKDIGKFPSKTEKSYYGVEYKYYLGSYKDKLEAGKGYHTEYIFQEYGTDGIILFLYFYRESKHLADVMFVTRFLEI